jgi:hypothetical protein
MAKKNRQQFAAQRAKQARQRRIIYLGIGLVAALVVAGLGVFFWMPGSATGSGNTSTTTDTGAAATCSDIQSIPDEGNAHLTAGQTPTYRSNPPSSGTHNPVPLAAGIYDQPVDVTMEVHSQEHGYIIMHYNGISQNEIDQLKQMVTNDPRKMILAPYLNMYYKVSLTAWDHQQTCTGVNRQAISNFVAEFRDRGPENVP